MEYIHDPKICGLVAVTSEKIIYGCKLKIFSLSSEKIHVYLDS